MKKNSSKKFLILQTEIIMSHSNPYYSKYSKKQYCPVKCSTEVDLELDVKQKVCCTPISKKGTEFDIELDFKVEHECKLVPKRTFKDETGCVTKCVFGVELDFKCIPTVRHNLCNKPSAKFQLDVELDVSPQCKPIEGCKVKYYKKEEDVQVQSESSQSCHSSQSSESEEVYCPPKKEEKKFEKKKSEKKFEKKKSEKKCDEKFDEKFDSKKFEDKYDDKNSYDKNSYDKSDVVDCDCDVCRPKQKEEDFECHDKKSKNSYWM